MSRNNVCGRGNKYSPWRWGTALHSAVSKKMGQGVNPCFSDVIIFPAIPFGIEIRARVSSFGRAMLKIVNEGVYAGLRHVCILIQVPFGIEIWVRIATLPRATQQIMNQWIGAIRFDFLILG